MKGRKPKPRTLHIVEGTARSHVTNPVAHGDLDDDEPPEQLNPAQREIWMYHVAHAPRKVLTPIDREALLTLVIAVELRNRALEELRDMPLCVENASGNLHENPLLRIVDRNTSTILRACAELGFSPTARARIVAPPDDADTHDPAEQFFGTTPAVAH